MKEPSTSTQPTIFLSICSLCQPCTCIRVYTTEPWCKAQPIAQMFTHELKHVRNIHIQPLTKLQSLNAKLHLLRISVTHAPLPIDQTLDSHHILQPSWNLFSHTPIIHPHPFTLSHFLCHLHITLAPATFPKLWHLKILCLILIKT